MNKKLLRYFIMEGVWYIHSEKLWITGSGKTKEEAFESFIYQWDYLAYLK